MTVAGDSAAVGDVHLVHVQVTRGVHGDQVAGAVVGGRVVAASQSAAIDCSS